MDIPGKLRADLKRIYGANDPLNYIEDAKVEPRCVTGAEEDSIIVKLRVPSRMEKFVASTGFPRTLPVNMMDAVLYSTAYLGDWNIPGVPKAPEKKPEKKIDPMEAVNFLKPKRIIFSGPKTIVFWPDGTKTIVSLMEGQEHDEYTAFCAAVVKKMFGATHKAKQFLEVVAVRPEPKPKKVKDTPEEAVEPDCVEVHQLGEQESQIVPHPALAPMPGTVEEVPNNDT